MKACGQLCGIRVMYGEEEQEGEGEYWSDER